MICKLITKFNFEENIIFSMIGRGKDQMAYNIIILILYRLAILNVSLFITFIFCVQVVCVHLGVHNKFSVWTIVGNLVLHMLHKMYNICSSTILICGLNYKFGVSFTVKIY